MAIYMRRVIGAAVMAVALLGVPGTGEGKDPNETVEALLTNCKQKGGDPELYCLGVIRGAATVLSMSKNNRNLKICPGGYKSFEQMRQLFINWADANPKHWQVEGVTGVVAVLMDAWPCK